MRLSWFSAAQLRRRAERKQRRTAATLRVRQLERRRVLDAAAQSVVVSAVTSADLPSAAETQASVVTMTQPPLTFNWTPTDFESYESAGSASFAQGAAANVPPVTVVPLDQNVDEGQLLDLSGVNGAPPLALFIDTDLGDTHTATVDWGDGSAIENAVVFPGVGAGALGGTHTYADQGTYTVTIVVMDSNGGMDSDTFDVVVDPVAPTATLGNSGPVVEGSSATVSFSNQFDPSSADTTAGFHYAYDLDNDGTFDVGDGTYAGSVTSTSENVAASFLGEGPGSHTVTARIIDKDGQFTDYATMIQVVNSAPTLTNVTGSTINENAVATVTATIVDPSATDVFSVQVDWLDGSTANITGLGAADSAGMVGSTSYQWTAATRSLQLSHQYLDDGLSPAASDTYNVSLNVSDDDGGATGPYIAPVTVNNVPPTLVVATMQNVLEGSVLDLSGTGSAPPIGLFADNGTLDTHTATIDWGDGSAVQSATVFQGMGSGALGGTHTYLENGLYTVTVVVMDDDGGTDTKSFMVAVGNVAPVVTLNAVPSINENGTTTLTGSYTDPGVLDGQTVTVDWDDPNYAANSTFAVPAIRDAGGTPTLNVGDTFNSSTDAAVLTITAINAATGQVSFSVQHQYLDDGVAPGNNTTSDSSTISVTVTDDELDSGSDTESILVNNVAPTVALDAVASINENGVATLTGSYTDIGLLDAHTLTVNWGDPNNAANSTFAIDAIRDAAGTPTLSVGDTFNSSTDSAVLTITAINAATGQVSYSVQHQYLDDGLAPGNGTTSDGSTITVTVADDDAQSGSDSEAVLVSNVAPTITLNAVPSINENGAATLTGSYTDIGLLDGHTLTVDWDDPNNGANSTFAIDAIRDAAGNPTLSVGDTFNSSTDSAVLTITAINAATGQVSFSVQHQYLDDGLAPGNSTTSDGSTIAVTIADDDGQSANDTEAVLVNNVAPTVTLNAVPAINENGSATLTGSYTDIGLLDGHTLTVDWDDPNNGANSTFAIPSIRNAAGNPTLSVGDTFNSSTDSAVLTITAINAATGQVSFSVQHQYLDDGLAPGNGTTSDVSTISVTVMDDDTQSADDTAAVTINNVAPVITIAPNQTRDEGQLLDLSGLSGALNVASFTDVGSLDLHTAQIDWGDGFVDVGIITEANGNGVIGGTHTYADNGNYTVTVTLLDDDGGSHVVSFTVLVSNVAPTLNTPVVSDNAINEGDSTSFTVDFSDPGFDNPLNDNMPPNGGEVVESFTYDIDWGDGRDAITGMAVADMNGAAGVPSTGSFGGSHTYADNGTYTVTVTIHDDDGGTTVQTFTIEVANVVPFLTGTNNLSANEGQAITLNGLGVGLQDPGFDNPLNTLDPANGGEVAETLSALSINWGDGTGDQPLALAEFQAIPFQGPTTATFPGAGHTYADNGTYTVTVRVMDDDMAGFTDLTFTITVNNVAPTLAAPVPSAVNTTENSPIPISFTAAFSDPGFDNPLNTLDPANGGEVAESFTFDVDWGDGRQTVSGSTTFITDVNGSPGVLSTGSFGGSHIYADDGTYTITVTIHDDDGGSHSQTFQVIVANVAPTIQPDGAIPPFAGTDVTTDGTTQIQVQYSDPGFDNTANQNPAAPPTITDRQHESFTHLINWGDGSIDAIHTYAAPGTYTILVTPPGGGTPLEFIVTVTDVSQPPVLTLVGSQASLNDPGAIPQAFQYTVNWGDDTGGDNDAIQTFTLMLKDPIGGPSLSTQTTVVQSLRTPGSEGVATTGSFDVVHQYLGPPNPLNPSADITVTVTVFDDNLGSDEASIAIGNPGIQVVNVAIDTTPDVARLEFIPQPTQQVILNQTATSAAELADNQQAGGDR